MTSRFFVRRKRKWNPFMTREQRSGRDRYEARFCASFSSLLKM